MGEPWRAEWAFGQRQESPVAPRSVSPHLAAAPRSMSPHFPGASLSSGMTSSLSRWVPPPAGLGGFGAHPAGLGGFGAYRGAADAADALEATIAAAATPSQPPSRSVSPPGPVELPGLWGSLAAAGSVGPSPYMSPPPEQWLGGFQGPLHRS